MNISATAMVNASIEMKQSQVLETAQLLLLKKTMDMQATGTMALLQNLPLATSRSLGTQLNTRA
jgi:hypothetical protein